jgi:IPT/TIG domain
MPDMPDTPTLAMPIGLPPDSASKDTHYQNLTMKLAAEIQSDLSIRIWTDPALPYATINPMVRSAAKFYPSGSTGPGGGTFATDTLIFSTWLWEYLSLRQSASASAAVPALIRVGNIDLSEMRTAVQAELNASARYANWTPANRAQFVTDFIAGSRFMLVDAGTKFGAGAADPSPSGSAPAGDRCIDFAFLTPDGTILDSQLYFEMWGTIGGDLVTGHPLLTALAREVTPGVAPIEGGTRIRVIGQGFTSTTTVSVGGTTALNLYVTPDGKTVYFDAPAGSEGAADVQVDTPSLPSKVIIGGLEYVSDLAKTVRAVSSSLAVGLGEIDQKLDDQITGGTVTDQARADARISVDVICQASSNIIFIRQAASNSPFTGSAIDAASIATPLVAASLSEVFNTILVKGV